MIWWAYFRHVFNKILKCLSQKSRMWAGETSAEHFCDVVVTSEKAIDIIILILMIAEDKKKKQIFNRTLLYCTSV